VKVFSPLPRAGIRQVWAECPDGYTVISASANRAGNNVIDWEPGKMTGSDASSTSTTGPPPAGTTFDAATDGERAPNGFHFSVNTNDISVFLICIPNSP